MQCVLQGVSIVCRRIYTLIGHRAEISSAQFNWDCSLIATGSMDKTCKLWDGRTGNSSGLPQFKVRLCPHGKADAKQVDAFAHCFRIISGQNIGTLRGHDDEVLDITFDYTGQYLLTASADSTARCYNVTTHQLISKMEGHEGEISKVTTRRTCVGKQERNTRCYHQISESGNQRQSASLLRMNWTRIADNCLVSDLLQPSRDENPDREFWQNSQIVGRGNRRVQTDPGRPHGWDLQLCLQLRRNDHYHRCVCLLASQRALLYRVQIQSACEPRLVPLAVRGPPRLDACLLSLVNVLISFQGAKTTRAESGDEEEKARKGSVRRTGW